MCNGHFLQNTVEDGLINAEHLRIIEELKDWLAKILPTVSLTTLEREAKGDIAVSDRRRLVSRKMTATLIKIIISQLNEHFYTELSGRFALSQELLALLTTELTNIHYQLLSFSFSSRCEYQHLDVTYFLQTYPEYVAFCRNYLEANRNRPILWNNKGISILSLSDFIDLNDPIKRNICSSLCMCRFFLMVVRIIK